MGKLVTDMNDRERARYAASFDSVAESARAAAEALRNTDDVALLPHLVMMGLVMPGMMKELLDIMTAATQVDVSDLDKPFDFGSGA
jgi:hypothetical protein